MAAEHVVEELRAAVAARHAFREIDRTALAGRSDAETYFAIADRMSAACDRLADLLAAAADEGFALRAHTRDGRMLLLNASASSPGKWQLTRFDREGEPWGDTRYERKRQAVGELLDECELQTLADMDGLIAAECALAHL